MVIVIDIVIVYSYWMSSHLHIFWMVFRCLGHQQMEVDIVDEWWLVDGYGVRQLDHHKPWDSMTEIPWRGKRDLWLICWWHGVATCSHWDGSTLDILVIFYLLSCKASQHYFCLFSISYFQYSIVMLFVKSSHNFEWCQIWTHAHLLRCHQNNST